MTRPCLCGPTECIHPSRLRAPFQCKVEVAAAKCAVTGVEALEAKFTMYRDAAPPTKGNQVEITTVRKTLNVVIMELARLRDTLSGKG